ncbi:MAG: type II toxin-antitoxin system Phd/YefM family antitoxin [Chloroflexi bacterium]|nr:type II toxin-antitoxin system Phd/YefM family antitoxin [Chloroflexota bacterium]
MSRVGIRELRQNASALLRRVQAGETIEVTDRGRPVARVVPIKQGRLDQMIADGLVTLPKRDLIESMREHPPIKLPPGPSVSEILAEMRADER